MTKAKSIRATQGPSTASPSANGSPEAPRGRQGRPTTYDQQVHDRIVLAVRAGNYLKVAAASAGIPESTFLRWMASPRHRRLQEDVRKAQAEFEVMTVGLISRQAGGNPSSAMRLLARRYPTRWGTSREVSPALQGDAFPETDEPTAESKQKLQRLVLPPDYGTVITKLMLGARLGIPLAEFIERQERGIDPGLVEYADEDEPRRKWWEAPERDDPDTPAGND